MATTIHLFSARPYDKRIFEAVLQSSGLAAEGYSLRYWDEALSKLLAASLSKTDIPCVFVNNAVDAEILSTLKERGVRGVLLRSAGFNHVDVATAKSCGIRIARVPAYSPHAVAEHTFALLLSLNRKIHRAYNRTREGNFSLEGLMGFDLHGKTLGLVGTGKIGQCAARIGAGFGMKVLAHDPHPCTELNSIATYLPLDELLGQSDVVSLHCPLTPSTRHLLDDACFGLMKQGVIVLNTSRGALMDTSAAIRALKSRKLGGLGLDVYEEEESLFFADHQNEIIDDDVVMRLMSFPNVLLTGHQAFFTREAMDKIADTTLRNAKHIVEGSVSVDTFLF
jgi:D-lactate dehydrogenase